MEERNTQEQVFYQDNLVMVTQSRYIAGSKTYAMRTSHRYPFLRSNEAEQLLSL